MANRRWQELLAVDRSSLAVAAAIPSAIGYALPLAIGLATGHAADGVTASAGALIVGFANLGGNYRIRAATLLTTTAFVAIAALLGGLAGPSVLATSLLMGAYGFAGGLLVALGRRPAFVGLLSTWSLLLASDLHLHGRAAFREAGLIALGGLIQSLVAIAPWPFRRLAVERRALADVYRALARYARAPSADALGHSAATLSAASETMGRAASNTDRETRWMLVEQGEWIRLELAALARSRAPGVESTLSAAADALDALADASSPEDSLGRLRRGVESIDEPVAGRRAASLLGWVSAAAGESLAGVAAPEPPNRQPLGRLRAEFTFRSAAFRHAVRLSVALIVGVIVYRGLSLGIGYWVPLTVLFVLRPDYGTTLSRGLGRILGTMAGVTIAWAIVTGFTPSDGEIAVLLTVLAGIGYALFPANYALFSVVLTVLIALLVEFSGGSPVGALIDRILDTLIGGAIALAAFALWPTREAANTRARLAAYVTAEWRWLEAILDAFGEKYDRVALRATRLAARRSRVEAHDAVKRALDEPPRRRPDGRPLLAVLTAMDQVSECALALVSEAHDGARGSLEALSSYRAQLGANFHQLAEMLADGTRRRLPLARSQRLTMGQTDPISQLLASETDVMLLVFEQLDRVFLESGRRRPR